VDGLARRGYEQRIYSLNDVAAPSMVRMLADSGAAVEIIGKARLLSTWGLLRLFRDFKRWRPHIVQTFLFFGDIVGRTLARAAGVGVIVSSVQTHNVDKSRWQLFLDRLTAPWAHGMVACSKHIIPFMLAEEGVTSSQVAHIPNGIDTARYRACVDGHAIRARLGIAPSTRVIGMVGRLYPQKGHKYLLDAFAQVASRLDDSVLLVVGDGPLLPRLQASAVNLGIGSRVRFLGERSDVPDILAAMDLYVHSSLWEGMPNAVMEAMARGRPVVATSVDGNKELITDGETGWLVEPADSEALASRIIHAAAHPREAGRMAAAAARHIELRFSADAMVTDFDRLYRNLLDKVDKGLLSRERQP
jgi:glycosyltransferase involved in cell wall biosynthesis